MGSHYEMKGMLQTVKRKLSNNGEQMGVASMDVDSGGAKAASANGSGAASPVNDVARSDVSLPKRERRRSFLARNQKVQALKDLPHLKDTSMQKREALFQQKLELCSVIFNFDDPTSDKRCVLCIGENVCGGGGEEGNAMLMTVEMPYRAL